MRGRKTAANCESCMNYEYDDDYECYVCTQDLDEDEMVRFVLSSVRTEPERPHLLILYLVFTLQTAVKFCGKTSQRILPLQGKLSMQALEWSSSIFPW